MSSIKMDTYYKIIKEIENDFCTIYHNPRNSELHDKCMQRFKFNIDLLKDVHKIE